MSSEMVEVEYDDLVHQTDRAWLLMIDGYETWFAKSMCDIDEEASTIEVPRWIAEEEDLL